MGKKILYTVLIAAVWVGALLLMYNNRYEDQTFANQVGIVRFSMEGSFGQMEVSIPAKVTVMAEDPFSLKVDGLVVDSAWGGGEDFKVGPMPIESTIELRYIGDNARLEYLFERGEGGLMAVAISDRISSLVSSLLVLWFIFGGGAGLYWIAKIWD